MFFHKEGGEYLERAARRSRGDRYNIIKTYKKLFDFHREGTEGLRPNACMHAKSIIVDDWHGRGGPFGPAAVQCHSMIL